MVCWYSSVGGTVVLVIPPLVILVLIAPVITLRSGFNAACNKCHLKAAFVVLSSRTNISKTSQPGFQELVR